MFRANIQLVLEQNSLPSFASLFHVTDIFEARRVFHPDNGYTLRPQGVVAFTEKSCPPSFERTSYIPDMI